MNFKLKRFTSRVVAGIDDRVFTGLILTIIIGLIVLSGALVRFDNLYYDLGRYLTFKQTSTDIVIVAIDESSLNGIGRWPWSRTVHAALVNKLKREQALVIGFDVTFSEPEISDPDADTVLSEAIGQANNVVLPIWLEVPYIGAASEQKLPVTILASRAAALGRIGVPLDEDGIARGVYLWEGISSDGLYSRHLAATALPSFAQSVLLVAKQLPNNINTNPPNLLKAEDVSKDLGRLIWQDARRVNFSGPTGHFQRISYTKVLYGDYPADFFKGKIVLVGATAAGMSDILLTPVSALSQPMPRVEFHANVIEAMRHSKLVVEAPLLLTYLFCALLALAPLLWLPKLSPLKSLFVINLYFVFVVVVVVSMPYLFNVWLPPTGALVAILLIYPIWSWRKLDSAHVFLDAALQNIEAELALMGVDKASFQYESKTDEMQSRILKVELTSKYLHDFQQTRRDTLAFISHDIRSPIGAAIMLLNEYEKDKYSIRIAQTLGRALNMADDFLQSSRAEMADATKFYDLELMGLLQQSIDDVYDVAHANKIKIEVSAEEGNLWIKGDFGLLQRAISNLLLNAVKYSPDNTTVKIKLIQVSNEAILSIADAGPGIPPEKLSKLFKRFSRVESQYQLSIGSGLGLYFVDVAIKKHHGSILAESTMGHGATFTIRLPLEKYAEKDMPI